MSGFFGNPPIGNVIGRIGPTAVLGNTMTRTLLGSVSLPVGSFSIGKLVTFVAAFGLQNASGAPVDITTELQLDGSGIPSPVTVTAVPDAAPQFTSIEHSIQGYCRADLTGPDAGFIDVMGSARYSLVNKFTNSVAYPTAPSVGLAFPGMDLQGSFGVLVELDPSTFISFDLFGTLSVADPNISLQLLYAYGQSF